MRKGEWRIAVLFITKSTHLVPGDPVGVKPEDCGQKSEDVPARE
jgi:hypothetical protein